MSALPCGCRPRCHNRISGFRTVLDSMHQTWPAASWMRQATYRCGSLITEEKGDHAADRRKEDPEIVARDEFGDYPARRGIGAVRSRQFRTAWQCSAGIIQDRWRPLVTCATPLYAFNLDLASCGCGAGELFARMYDRHRPERRGSNASQANLPGVSVEGWCTHTAIA